MISPALTVITPPPPTLRSPWQEASELSSLKPQLEELGVPLVAVVKENIGTEIEDFRPHFAGDIYIDEEVGGTSSLKTLTLIQVVHFEVNVTVMSIVRVLFKVLRHLTLIK